MIYWPAKAPGEVEDFAFDFAGALQTGETISSRTVTATGVTKNSDAIVGSTVAIWLSGGTLGTPGVVTCSIVTSSGRTYFETAIVPIGEEPVTLTMAKRQVRADLADTTDDEYLLELIQGAREHAEAYTGTRLVPAAVQMTFPTFDHLDLTQAPVQSITAVQYLDANGALQTLDPSIYEFVNIDADTLRPTIRLAYNQAWPPARTAADAVRVSAVVGYTVVPRPIIRAMLVLIYQWFDIRSGVQVDARGAPAEIPNTVAALLANYRR